MTAYDFIANALHFGFCAAIYLTLVFAVFGWLLKTFFNWIN